MIALLLALALAGAPFPAPRTAAVTDRLKSDAGTVLVVDADRGELRAMTAAGVVTFRVGPGVPVLDSSGRPLPSLAALAARRAVRVWYVVEEGGARVLEIAAQ
jgi:hypothetical protein